MSKASSFRLENSAIADLVWLFTRSEEATGGVAAQCYRSAGGAGTSPDRLYFQEAAVDSRGSSLARVARLHDRRRRVLAEEGGLGLWSSLEAVYGATASPWESTFGDVAALALGTEAVRERALLEWVESHVEANPRRYGWWAAAKKRESLPTRIEDGAGNRVLGKRETIGGWEATARMLRLLPDSPTEEEVLVASRRVLDGIARRARDSRLASEGTAPAEKLLGEVRAQADLALSDASRAWARACMAANSEEARAKRRGRREDREAVAASGTLVERLERLLENWPGHAQAAE